MSMATRCTACGTVFRVVQDQLKVSEGWVRCGRCDQVFNAIEGLFDLERESPPPWQAGGPAPQQRDSRTERSAAALDEDDRIASRFFMPAQEDVERTPAEAVAERDRVDFADAQFEEDDSEEPLARPRGRKGKAASPEFLRHAEREAHWRSPRMRVLLSLAGLLLAMTLALQVGHHFRDVVAQHWPQAAPVLTQWCAWAHCGIEMPRHIEDITVENTGLTLASPGSDTFKFSVTLRNRGALAVSMPSIELSLTDASGQLVARRALNPPDFGSSQPGIAPGVEVPLQLLFTAATTRISGYTVEVFYP
jgi:predicted Zn finger-like uncharacterized protein